MKITALCLSTTLQRTAVFNEIHITEVNRSSHLRFDASGKAVNVARVLNQIESNCTRVICPIGKENAAIFRKLADSDGLDLVPVLIPGFTRECLTMINKSTKEVTELVMDEPVLSQDILDTEIAKAEKELIKKVFESFKDTKAFAFAGSRPKIWSKNLNPRLCKKAIEMGLVVLVDFLGEDLTAVLDVCTPQIIKINAKEFCTHFNLACENDTEQLHKEICKKSVELQNCIVITRGKDSTLAAYKGNIFEQDGETVEVVNTIGCGDSFSAGFLHEYLKNTKDPDIQGALQKGTWTAARNAESLQVGSIKADC